MAGTLQFDEIGYWTELKLDIVREYAAAYSTIVNARKFHHVYIDAFAGAGVHISKVSQEFVQGSPLNALLTDPPFREFFFIDIESQKTDLLRHFAGEREDVHIFQGDCNEILLTEVFPKIRYEDYRRGLCLLDPYGLHLNWEVIARAGAMKTIDMFLNFPIMDMHRNSIWRQPERVSDSGIDRMNAYWGDDSWRRIAYKEVATLFGPIEVKEEGSVIVKAFCERLRNVAGFENVARPLPMKNMQGAIVYYLLFASQKQVAGEIVNDIFQKYERRGMV
ncbi:MAG: three-Cys-motif partner protein TcmP [Acidobacteria bacterium]|nr:three-Cys-motif partner protein TcmP [Acidobacteriota bacterium]